MASEMKLTAGNVMSGDVVGVAASTPLHQAARLMCDKRFSGLPVVDEAGHPVGMVTEGDLLRRVETGTQGKAPGWLSIIFAPGRLAQQYIRTHARTVSEVMTPGPECVQEDTPLEDVVTIMQRRGIKRLPVLREGRLVGIVSRADLVCVLADALAVPVTTDDDLAIRERLIAEMKRQPWTHARAVSVAVENGTVLLDGCVFDMRERDALKVLAENVAGVQGVENRLVCVEPNTGVLMYDPFAEAARREPPVH